MRKILTIGSAALALGVAAIALPSGAEARFGAGVIAQATDAPAAQPVQYYGGYYRPYYAPRYYGGYYGGGYYDYYRYGYPGSRDSLNTCSYC